MSDYILSCSSTADLTEEHFSRRAIRYICFHYTLDGVEYPDDLGKSMAFDTFYDRIAAGSMAGTSQISVGEYEAYFEAFLKDGLDIVHVTLSSGISGTYTSACVAAEVLREHYPERRIYIVDSLAASSGYGLLMDAAADRRDAGLGAAELADWLERNKRKLNHWFFSTDLTSYVRGGRISRTAAVFGGLLKICPLLNVDKDGRLIPRKKVPGKNRVIAEIVRMMEENAEGGRDYAGKCYISNSACMADARRVADAVEEKFPHLNGKVEIYSVGTTIGAHTGPGTVALFFWGRERDD